MDLYCRTLFPEGYNVKKDGSRLLQLTPEQNKSMKKSAVFCDPSSTSIIPSLLTVSSNKVITPAEFLRQSNSGVVKFSTENSDAAYDMFTRMHGILKLLADLVVSSRQARLLAGTGGDILIYGEGGEQIRALMRSFEAVQMELLKLVHDMKEIGIDELEGMKSSKEKAWRNCFSRVLSLENYICHDVEACMEPIRRIIENTHQASVQAKLAEFRDATKQWVQENNMICAHVGYALRIEPDQMSSLQVCCVFPSLTMQLLF